MKKLHLYIISALAAVTLNSCTSYLDKEADSTISEEEAYKNFTNFQGFVEEIYNCIPEIEVCNFNVSFNLGDDEIMDTQSSWMLGPQFDLGNFWAWQTAGCNWLYQGTATPNSTSRFAHSIYGHAWYCVRKANIGIQNINKMTESTAEEKELILGQLYFFRAWWHFQLIKWFGGLPYITYPLDPANVPQLTRLSYQQCADSAAIDFRRAADLLPIDWDNTTAGRNTASKNMLRINKITALAYLGKNYLWAGSPLMKNGATASAGDLTYEYDTDYCKKAAEAFGELLKLVETGQTQYDLAEFKYSDVYNHEATSSSESCFSEIFYTQGQSYKLPGSCEAIMRSPGTDDTGASNWGFDKSFGPIDLTGGGVVHVPAANFVNYAYGMANGLPIDDPDSGFDPTHPFKNRTPRFYHDIIYDGCKYIKGTLTESFEPYRYASLYTGGLYRNESKGSRTGYLYQKLAPHNCNLWDGGITGATATACSMPYLRLADVYLMYAEACAAIGGARGLSDTYPITALEAINKLRDRVGEGHVASKFTSDAHKFMDELRRERTVELAFEGHRFNDLQRWLLLTDSRFTTKTSQEFERVEDLSYFEKSTNSPSNAEVKGWSESTLVKRNYTARNYWLPFFKKEVSLYEGFSQNPGW